MILIIFEKKESFIILIWKFRYDLFILPDDTTIIQINDCVNQFAVHNVQIGFDFHALPNEALDMIFVTVAICSFRNWQRACLEALELPAFAEVVQRQIVFSAGRRDDSKHYAFPVKYIEQVVVPRYHRADLVVLIVV